MYTREADRKTVLIFGRKRKCRRNEIPFTTENETKMDIPSTAEKRKRKSPDNISVFFIHSVTNSPIQ